METAAARPAPARSETQVALARAALYRFLSLATSYPAEDVARELRDPEAASGFEHAASVLDGSGGLPGEPRSLQALVRRAVEGLASSDDLSGSYARVFSHSVHGTVPAYELEYGAAPGFLGPHTISDLGGTYAAHGLLRSDLVRERPDHVSVEAEFLSFLAWKEAFADETLDEARIANCRSAERSFLRDHFARWTLTLGRKLDAAEEPYRALGALVRTFVRQEARRFGVEPGGEDLEIVEPASDEKDCFACPFVRSGAEAGAAASGTSPQESTPRASEALR